MKIRKTATAALLAASALAVLAPSQAFAAPQAPPCTKKNIAYLDAQNHQEDAEAKVTAAEQALDRAKADRAKLDRLARLGEALDNALSRDGSDRTRSVAYTIHPEQSVLAEAVWKHDAAASADAAVKLADATEKALKDEGEQNGYGARLAGGYVKSLRADAETARSATEAPNVEARQADLDTARTELTKAAKAVRPARDTYRDCLDKLVH
ncbi:hypothetical protein ACGFYQ_08840 [Streptomyces sp. NPDC048258]|uniref:hypothetical protein n=1 Tax=Streptomyces sp. NPDC048258 TaxID=3365527 RepID=UPI0037170D47